MIYKTKKLFNILLCLKAENTKILSLMCKKSLIVWWNVDRKCESEVMSLIQPLLLSI